LKRYLAIQDLLCRLKNSLAAEAMARKVKLFLKAIE